MSKSEFLNEFGLIRTLGEDEQIDGSEEESEEVRLAYY